MTRVCVAMKQMMMILIVIGMAIMTPLEGFGASLWPSTTVPGIVDAGADNPVELGVRFRSDSSGSISGIRFYKSAANSGPHTARLWSSGGALLASATFSNETPSGWQQANFSAPVAINANTVYVASYHTATGHYSYNQNYFTGAGQDTPPLHALADGISGANGVFTYGSAGSFPYSGWNGSNYWVDVVFNPTASESGASIWPTTTIPGIVDAGADNPVELGVKFRSDSSGSISGIRFYKSAANSGPHTARLWSSGGALLATATFSNETPSGWQQANFSAPVAINANTVYVASYHTATGHYSYNQNYFTGSGHDTPPLHALADGISGANGVFAYGSAGSFPYGGWNGSNYWVDVVFNTASATDNIAPTVTAFTVPASSSTLTVSITALSASDNIGVTGYLVTESSTPPPASHSGWSASAPVSYTFAEPGSKVLYAWARDATGNVSASSTASVTVTAFPSGASIWPSTTVPGVIDSGEAKPVELGVKFRSDSSGSVSGIRFYKSAANSGPHTARLWSSGGALLATATFSNETPSGWQQANFSAPVAINANTVYVASYHTATGHYSYNLNYFTGSGRDTPPLHALADGISGANGVFAYGSAGSFPYGGWNGSNYWVDVVFSTASVTDNIAPTVTAFSVPASSATLTVSITALNASDNIGVTGYLITESSTPPPASHSGWSANVPVSYTFGEPGSKILHAWARDAAGNVSASSTASVTVTVSTSDGSILLISSAANPFSGYYAEILRAEGFTTFNQVDISSLTSATLAAHDLVILGEMTLSDSQASLFNSWVTGGGKLIAMRPDKKLAALFGLTNQNSGISNGYIRVDTAAAPGAGIVGETMQYHGVADLYALNGAKGVATLYSSASAATSNPAVSLHNVGSNGGQAAAFAYDLARSVVYTRQGNPAWAGQERDGDSLMRSDDLFYGPARFDPQPNWIDLGKVAIPQADEQQRLLANLMIHMNMTKKPLPRFWYLPRNLAAAVVMTGDDHGEGSGGTKGRFNLYQYISRPGCSVDNWECIRGSSYIYTANSLTNTEAAAFNGAGFEIGLHVNTNCANWTPASLNSFYDDQLASFGAKYPGVPAPVTNRTHCIAWSDYTSQSSIELAHDIRLDTSYYYWPPHWVANNPGFFTGSGMPMRFANADGTLIDVYQAATQMTDESGQSYPFTVDSLLDNALGPEGFYGTFVVNAHTDFDNSSVSESVIESARVRDVPVISARQLLKWTDGRNASSFNALTWNGTTLGFSLTAGPGTSGLTAMVPIPAGRSVTGITRNGYAVEFAAVVIKGVAYARFGAPGGSYQVSYSLDTAAPEISSITPAEGAGNVELFTHVTATFNKPVDPNTVHSGTFRLHDPSSTVVEASVELNTATNTAILIPTSPLRGSTTYSVTVYGGSSGVKDLAGNALASSMTWSFTTRQVSTGATSIWPASRVPSTVDAGADSPVELGVKFRSDKSGYITGIRFYKSAANTGTHTASLWSAGGTRMATTTFGGETASGWQQVNFSNPVAITANTVYVASYHTNVGHYSYDDNFFQGKGVDNPPLHALADGVSGSNGVFAYGSGSNFPNQGWNSSNYWVDVVFSETSGQNLFSGSSLFDGAQPVEPYITMISVTPDNQRIAVGTTQQFSAVATYSNGRTEDVSNKVSWASSAADVVTVSSTGLVTAHGPGTSTITVTLNGITGTTTTTATVGMARLLTVLRTDIM